MRSAVLLCLATTLPAGAAGGALAAQAVERSDVPGSGMLRLTFDPRITVWNAEFVGGARLRLGWGLTGDTVGGSAIPAVGRLEQDVRAASGLPGFVASLGSGLLSVHQERRVTPIHAELGLTDRLSLAVMVPIVRVATRARLQLSSKGANLGLNPLLQGVRDADAKYSSFFAAFDSTLKRLDQNIAAGQYGCPASGPCAARDSSAGWRGVYSALYRTVYGVGQTGQPFMPRDSSDGGRGIDTTVARIERGLQSFGVSGFTNAFLLATDTLTDTYVQQAIIDSARGFGYRGLPYRDSFRYGLGDVEVEAKYRLAAGTHYAAAVVALVRLPTAPRDSGLDWLRQSVGDHATTVEGRFIQELTLGTRLWLNLALQGGFHRAGTQVRRVAPFDAFLVPFGATTELAWTAGRYAGVDLAPLYRFAPQFAAGVTAGYWSKARDRYAFRSPQDSLDLAARLGGPVAASVLEQGTSERRLRLGVAVSYIGSGVEGGFSIEQTVTGGGVTPAATVFRILVRTSRKLF